MQELINGTEQLAYDGSSEQTLNITPFIIGAVESNHTHIKSQITDFLISLPANGGNADNSNKFGNYDLSHFMALKAEGESYIIPSATDFNIVVETGFLLY